MIRQSQDRGGSQKDRRQATAEPKCQDPETQEILTVVFDGDDLDPADFYEPEDLQP